ncbi:hypothetical protein VB779_21720 [Haloarculaceae archaeon H-GB11]|nr:hypothetical protein [Haloarculaceae archaeon H-GB11]
MDESVFAGLGYGLALSVVGDRVVLDRLLEQDTTADERLVFYVGHAIYALSLGTWVGVSESFGELYE